MGIGYLTPADRFFNAAIEVEKAMNLSTEDGLNFYLTGKIEGQPVRAVKDKSGQITVYLASHPVKVLNNLTELNGPYYLR